MTSPHDPRPWQRPDESGGRPASASLVDPEDDLPSANYGGDFETTAIPRYDAAKPTNDHPFGLMNDPEPLPYVQPGGGLAAGAYGAPAAPAEVISDPDRRGDADRRGTQDLGLLLLRVAVGALFIGQGLQKVFGWWGGPGLGGFRDSLTEWGFQNADILTYVAAGGQIAAGVLLVLGLFTPIAAAGALGYLVTALLVEVSIAHDEARLSAFLTDGHQYQLILVCAVAAIILIGPGRYGLDVGRGWARRPFIGSFAALILGVGAGVAIWVLLNGANPLAAVSGGSVVNVTAGSDNSLPSRRRARAHDRRPNLSPSMSSHCTVSLPSSVRAVTPSRSAVVRYRMITSDRITGMTSSSTNQPRSASTTESSPNAKRATARCAIGEILMTTGVDADAEGEPMPPSFHRQGI